MSSKEIVKELLEKLPEEASLTDIVQEIEFVAGIREGVAELDRGEGLTADQLKGTIALMDQFQVIFAPRAERDLKSIAFHIARRSNSEIAERFGNRLIDRALTLATLPERGRVVPELGQADVREIIFKSYRIVYRIHAGRVEVIRFWHAARGAPEIDSDEF